MEIIYHPIILEHLTNNHPESKERILSLGSLPITNLPLSEEPLSLIHTMEYIQHVKNLCAKSLPLDPDTQTSPGSFNAALYSVAATIKASEIGGFAVVRPPGHHAYPDHGSGFCLFNNMAIATEQFVRNGKRVLIIDIDGHLGDGTEHIFYSSNSVFYWSLHQENVFPPAGTIDQIGDGNGAGYTINIPLPILARDDMYLTAVRRFLPIVKQFHPDVVGVSAGFDGHHSDPLLRLNLSVDCYYELGRILKNEFINVFATLEGGYNTNFLPKCFMNFLNGINGKDKLYSEETSESTILALETFNTSLDQLLAYLKPYWNTNETI
jgi:acetoin utilization deacetylase AcuC-like enzyme